MKKKLMFSFALVILMFSLVITYSIYNLNSVSDELVHNRTINLSFYQQNNKFKEEILNFKSNISKIFIFDSIEDIENIYGTASENINSAQSILKEIKDTKYAELHLLKFPNEKEIPLDEPIEESKDEDTVSEITVLEAIDEVESGLGSMQKYADILYSQYKKVAENRNQFQDSYKKVYNSYRLVDFYPFLNDKKSINRFLNLSRAMFTTMASNSTRDLNFVGRSKFNSSVKYFDSLISEDKNYENFKNEYQKLFDTAIFISSNKPQNIFELFELETKSLNSSINTLLVISDKLFEKSQDSILSRVSNLKVLPIVISIIVAIVGLVISWISLSNISNSIMKIVNEFTQQSIRLQNSSNQVVEFGNQLKSQTIQQSSSTEQSAASLEEIGAMVGNNVKSVKSSNEQSHSMQEKTDIGLKNAAELKEAMDAIDKSINNVVMLSEKIEDISEKTAIIDDIVFQTKLLSFNASVEAERAGEYGAGFSVVAKEISNLATSSGVAASEISKIVKDGREMAKDVSEESKKNVDYCATCVQSVSEALSNIQKEAMSLRKNLDSVLESSEQQHTSVVQIQTSVSELEQIAQTTTRISEETNIKGLELLNDSNTMNSLVKRLSCIVLGNSEDKK